jgi:hypothetical protein
VLGEDHPDTIRAAAALAAWSDALSVPGSDGLQHLEYDLIVANTPPPLRP